MTNATLIPIVHTLPEPAYAHWLAALNTAASSLRFVSIDACTSAERAATEVVIVADPDAEDLASLPALRWAQGLWAGVDNVLPILPSGVDLVRMQDPEMATTMAEAVLAWTLYLHRDMPTYRAQQAQKNWTQQPYIAARDRKVAVLGQGNMGRAAAQRLHANGFDVTGWSRRAGQADYTRVNGADVLPSLLAQSDIVVLLLPLTNETCGMFDAARLAQMKPGSALINFARGPVVEPQALLSALDGRLSHAVLDVFDVEPLPRNHAYWEHPKITVLPHISGPTTEATAARVAVGNIEGWLERGVMPETVERSRGY